MVFLILYLRPLQLFQKDYSLDLRGLLFSEILLELLFPIQFLFLLLTIFLFQFLNFLILITNQADYAMNHF